MRELVLATVAEQPDVEVVGEADNDRDITELVERTRPDCLIIALAAPEQRPGLCGFLLARYPAMRVLAVGPGQQNSIFFCAFVDIRSQAGQTTVEGIRGAGRNCVDMS